MAVCDICNAPGMGTLVSAEQMREAVFSNGFNPFRSGLAGMGPMSGAFGIGGDAQYNQWKNTIVAQDTSDWNVCTKCMGVLQGYLKGPARSNGVRQATVSSNPTISSMAGAAAEQKYKTEAKPAPKPKKKWWQFRK